VKRHYAIAEFPVRDQIGAFVAIGALAACLLAWGAGLRPDPAA
jgi:hypothetical protein